MLTRQHTQPPPYHATPSTHAPPALDKLPAYSAGVTVAPPTSSVAIKSPPPGLLAVDLDRPAQTSRGGQPVYDIGDLVTGKLMYVPKRSGKLVGAHVALAGELVVGGKKQQLKVASYTIQPDALPSRTLKKGWVYSFRFSILVPAVYEDLAHDQQDSTASAEETRKARRRSSEKQEFGRESPLGSGTRRGEVLPSWGETPDRDQCSGTVASGGASTLGRVYYYITGGVETKEPKTETSAQGQTQFQAVTVPLFVLLRPSHPADLAALQARAPVSSPARITKRAGVMGLGSKKELGQVKLVMASKVPVVSVCPGQVSVLRVHAYFLPTTTTTDEQGQGEPPEVSIASTKLVGVTSSADKSKSDKVKITELPVPSPSWSLCTPASQGERPTGTTHVCTLEIPVQVHFDPCLAVPSFTSQSLAGGGGSSSGGVNEEVNGESESESELGGAWLERRYVAELAVGFTGGAEARLGAPVWVTGAGQ